MTSHLLRTLSIFLYALMVSTILIAPQAYAQINAGQNAPGTQTNACDPPPANGQTLVNPLKGIDCVPELLSAVLEAVVYLGGIVLTLAIIYVGFLFVAARGRPAELERARRALIWTLIGGLILLGAQAISLTIQSTVNSLR